jgi:hypothetical protein
MYTSGLSKNVLEHCPGTLDSLSMVPTTNSGPGNVWDWHQSGTGREGCRADRRSPRQRPPNRRATDAITRISSSSPLEVDTLLSDTTTDMRSAVVAT